MSWRRELGRAEAAGRVGAAISGCGVSRCGDRSETDVKPSLLCGDVGAERGLGR